MQLSGRTAIVLAACGFTYWLTFGGTFGGALSWKHQLVGHMAVFLTASLVSWKLWRLALHTEYRSLPAGVGVLIGLVLAEKLVSAFLHRSWNSVEDLAFSISALIVFIVLLNLFRSEKDLSTACVLAAVSCTLLGMILAYLRNDGELALPLGSRVLMAGLLTLVLPVAISRFRTCEESLALRLLWLGGAIILAAGIARTGSGVAIALLPFAVCLPLIAFEKRRTRITLVLGVVILMVCGGLYVGHFKPVSRVYSIVHDGIDSTQSLDNRVRYWAGALPAINQRLLIGWGAGAVGVTYPAFRIQRPGYAPAGEVVPDLHSVPMQWAYEFGLIGLALRVALFGGLLFVGYSRQTLTQRTAVIALGLYGVFCLFHYDLTNPATVVTSIVVAAIIVRANTSVMLTPTASKPLALVLILMALSVLSYQLRQDYANYLLSSGVGQLPPEAIGNVIRSGIVDSRGGFYDAMAAIKIDQLSNTGKDPQVLLNAADNHYRMALTLNPWSPQITAAYGDFLVRSRRDCDAVETLQRAVSLDFYFSLSHFDLANAYASCRSADQAAKEAGIAILTTPALVYSTQWRKDPAFLERALGESLAWMVEWKAASSSMEGEQLRRLENFVQTARSTPVAGHTSVKMVLSEQVAAELTSDPFAYVFQRRSILFQPTRIEIDGVDTGTWTPEGIGKIKSLRSLQYTELASAYQHQTIHVLMGSLMQPTDRR